MEIEANVGGGPIRTYTHIYRCARALAQKHTRTRYRRGEWAENTMHAISRHRGLIPNQNPSLPG